MNPLDESLRERSGLDSVKGLLILAVVLGHSPLADPLIPGLKNAVYAFHVQGFLLLPFLFAAPALTRAGVGNLLVRYLVAYIAAVGFFSVLHAIALGDLGSWAWFSGLLQALGTENAGSLKQATGFSLFWLRPGGSTLARVCAEFSCRSPRATGCADSACSGRRLTPESFVREAVNQTI
jgi:hypothetical protein